MTSGPGRARARASSSTTFPAGRTPCCSLGALYQHVGQSTPGARAIVTELMREWQESLAAGIRAMQRNGNLPLSLDVDQAAAALLAGIQGGVSIMLSTGQSAHLRAALDWGIARLRATGGTAG